MTKCVLFFVGCVISSSIAIPLSSDSQSNSESGNGSVNDGFVDQFVNHMWKGLKLSNETLGEIKKFQNKIERMKNQIDNKIQAITQEIGLVAAEHMKYSKLAITEYRNVKSIIRRERNSLFKLADKTERVTEDMIIFMEGWGPEYGKAEKKSFLLEQMKLLRELIDKSKIVLANAEEKYQLASTKMDEIDSHLSDFRRALARLTDEHSAEYDEMAHNIRAGAYGAGAGILAGTILLDIFGCLGLCSGLYAGSQLAVTVPLVETDLAEAEGRLNTLQFKVENASKDVKLIQEDTKTLKKFINQEITLLSKWQGAAEQLEAKMSYADGKLDIGPYRKSFTKAIQGLHAIASEFSNRPAEILRR